MTNARQGWNAAQLASERKARKKVAHGPVGERLPHPLGHAQYGDVADHSCAHCGYHVCSCAQVPSSYYVANKFGGLTKVDKASSNAIIVDPGRAVPSCSAPNCCCDKCWMALKQPDVVDYATAAALGRDGFVVDCTEGVLKGMQFTYDPDEKRWGGSVDKGRTWLATKFPNHAQVTKDGCRFEIAK